MKMKIVGGPIRSCGSGGRVRVGVNEELKFFVKIQNKSGGGRSGQGGSGSGWGGQGGCE